MFRCGGSTLLVLAKCSLWVAPCSAETDRAKGGRGEQPRDATQEVPVGGEEQSVDADALGFADDAQPRAQAGEATSDNGAPAPIALGGQLRSQWGMWLQRLDDNPFAKGRQSIDLYARYAEEPWRVVIEGHAEYDVAYLVQRDTYDEATLETYEWLAEPREVYVSLGNEHTELVVGRQIVAWGVGSVFSPVDVVNPRDEREPVQADLEDIRLPTTMTRLRGFVGHHQLEAMVVHEAYFGRRPPPLGAFSPFPHLPRYRDLPQPPASEAAVFFEDDPSLFELQAQQYFASWTYRGPAVDVAIHGGSALDRDGVVEDLDAAPPDGERVELRLSHRRYALAGLSGAWPIAQFVVSWEALYEHERAFNVFDRAALLAVSDAESSRFTGMLGFSYSGIEDSLVAFEFSQARLFNDIDVVFPWEQPAFALRAQTRWMREDLRLDGLLSWIGLSAQHGAVVRLAADYRLAPALWAGVGYVGYVSGDEFGPFAGFDSHDRLLGQLRWDFSND